uniref:Uncharacterized protein n=1 Tax=Mus musculus TaxID=10090 RepID=Q8CDJ2_MOUSE|nr:unnamed protein product [Mus musculus]
MPASPPADLGFLELDLSSASNQMSSGNVFAAAHGSSRVNGIPRHSSTALQVETEEEREVSLAVLNPFSSSNQCQESTAPHRKHETVVLGHEGGDEHFQKSSCYEC